MTKVRGRIDGRQDRPVTSRYPTDHKEYERSPGRGSSRAEGRNRPALASRRSRGPSRARGGRPGKGRSGGGPQ